MVEAGPGLLTGSSTISTASPSTTNILFTRSSQTESLEKNKVLDEWLSRLGREATQVNIFFKPSYVCRAALFLISFSNSSGN